MGKNWFMRCVILEIGEDGVFYFIKCWFIIEKKNYKYVKCINEC